MPATKSLRVLLPAPARLLGDRAEIEDFYGWRQTPAVEGTSWVRANFVASLDGAIEVGGRSSGLGGPADRTAFGAMRTVCDVVLVGANTARIEQYRPAYLDDGARERRAARRLPELPTVAVVTRSGALDPAGRLFDDRSYQGSPVPRPVVITCEATPPERRRALSDVAQVLVCGDGEVVLESGLAALAGEGLARVLCEGGPTLFAELAAADLVDELCLTYAPLLAGPGRRRLTAGASPWSGTQPWALTALLEGDGMLLARYAAPAAPDGSSAGRQLPGVPEVLGTASSPDAPGTAS